MSATITEDGGLLLPSGTVVRFERPIIEVVESQGIVVVLVASDLLTVTDAGAGRTTLNFQPERVGGGEDNVYGVGTDGAVLWRVAHFDFPHGPSPYTGVNLREGVVYLYNFRGVECRIDVRTGAILSTQFTR